MSNVISAIFPLSVLFLIVVFLIVNKFKRVFIFEYEKGLKYYKGKFVQLLEPGVYLQTKNRQIEKIDIRKNFEIIPGQEILTSDGVSVKLTLTASYQVIDPKKVLIEISNYQSAFYIMLQSIVRVIIGKIDLESLLKERDNFIQEIAKQAEVKSLELGLKVSDVAIRDIMLSGELKKAISQVATAKQESLAKLERSRGESAALRNLANTAKMIEDNPNLLQLRILDAISQSSGNTIVFGSPEAVPLVIKK
ncbi:MAG: slipin family protein [Patescibacteria group bacterium]|jgi:regulator of protease activity HflC (stomatin/prohibitin superfamily)